MKEMNRFIHAIIVIQQEKLISVINIVMPFQVSLIPYGPYIFLYTEFRRISNGTP